MIVEYISAPGFRRTYPLAYQKWLDARQCLRLHPSVMRATVQATFARGNHRILRTDRS